MKLISDFGGMRISFLLIQTLPQKKTEPLEDFNWKSGKDIFDIFSGENPGGSERRQK